MKSDKKSNPAVALEESQFFGEFGGVNPSISDSSTYTFMSAETMDEVFEGEGSEGCFLYSRHSSPSSEYLASTLADMEFSEAGCVTGSGISAIVAVLMHYCGQGDHVVSSRTIYGGSYAFLENLAPKYGISTSFVDINALDEVEALITEKTKVIYCESLSNPLLAIADIPALAAIAQKHNVALVVDNTFTPLLISPQKLGATVTIHSVTKFINGSSDSIAGAICGSAELIEQLRDVAGGTAMLFGAVLDSWRASSILKNVKTLSIRMEKHSANAMYLAKNLEQAGVKVSYPGLESHPKYQLFKKLANPTFGFGGMLTLDLGTFDKAAKLMKMMQEEKVGYLAVSLGFYKTLFSASANSTSSEIPEEEREEMGLTDGLIRFSVGLDYDIHHTFEKIIDCLKKLQIL